MNNKEASMNPLKSREDVQRCLVELLSPLKDHAAPGGYQLGDTAAHYSPRIALMEGWSRPLWGIGPLIAGGGTYPDIEVVLSILRQGVDPDSPGYWGDISGTDQRMVEMAAMGLCLIIAKKTFWDSLDKKTQEQLYTWLSFIEREKISDSNWHFFRVLVSEAFRALELPVDEKAEKESLERIDSFYVGDGWYQDGMGGNYDYYNPFGFHFYSLVYAKLALKRDPERAARYIERAKLFIPRFTAWCREDGSIIPMGRSLTYRFAIASLFSACAFTEIEILPWGVLKGLVLRNLRWWFSRPILDAGGILSIGYGYPNLIMADTYNSPGSPYWGMKAFLILALEKDHPFWTAEELPLRSEPEKQKGPFIQEEKVPGFIISNTAEDAQLLTPGRLTHFEMNHAAEKYCKFAYSARFGFCVSHSNYNLSTTGCDSMLMLSEKNAGYWRQRRETTGQTTGSNWTRSIWKPWDDVEITTTLVSLGAWHVRIHCIKSGRSLDTAEGGFSIKRYNELEEAPPFSNTAAGKHEALVSFDWGASRIAALEQDSLRQGSLVIPAPNLNIMENSAVIPVLTGTLEPGTALLVCAVRAGDRKNVCQEKIPAIRFKDNGMAEIFDQDGKSAALIAI
ncbi:hypothetical protein FACS189485_09290 [Spirochaetia bacterium]|nr:hypothetical protein FACS189485_09290 [Spirochaetia bacterium]